MSCQSDGVPTSTGRHARAPRVGLDHQEDREEVEQRRDRGHDDHLQVGDRRNSAMMNAAAPSAGGQMMAPMPAADRIAPPMSGGISRALQQRPCHRAERHGVGHAAPRDRAEQQPGDGDGAARARRRRPTSRRPPSTSRERTCRRRTRSGSRRRARTGRCRSPRRRAGRRRCLRASCRSVPTMRGGIVAAVRDDARGRRDRAAGRRTRRRGRRPP